MRHPEALRFCQRGEESPPKKIVMGDPSLRLERAASLRMTPRNEVKFQGEALLVGLPREENRGIGQRILSGPNPDQASISLP
jgi:hypothetical protein